MYSFHMRKQKERKFATQGHCGKRGAVPRKVRHRTTTCPSQPTPRKNWKQGPLFLAALLSRAKRWKQLKPANRWVTKQNFIPECAVLPRKGTKYCHVLPHGWTPKTSGEMEAVRGKRPRATWFHSHEMPRLGVVRGYGGARGGDRLLN